MVEDLRAAVRSEIMTLARAYDLYRRAFYATTPLFAGESGAPATLVLRAHLPATGAHL